MVDKYLIDILICLPKSWMLMKLFVVFTSIIAITLLLTAYSSGNPLIQLQQQAVAQTSDTMSANSTTATSADGTGNRTNDSADASPSQTIFYRGIEASKEPVHVNHSQPDRQHQTLNILLHRDDGASYKGVLTFTATEPVDIGIGHGVPLDNSTFSQIELEELDELFTVTHNDKGELGVPGIVSAPSRITPDYGINPPYFSASIPFVGSSRFLSTMSGEYDPFVAVYEVSAEIIQPQHVVDLHGLNVDTNTNTNTNKTATALP